MTAIVRHRAAATVAVTSREGVTRARTMRCEPPLTFRETPDGIVWVGTAAGPLGGDDLHLRVDVDPGAQLRMTSAAAAIVLPGVHGDPSRLQVDVTVGSGSTVRWAPEPTVVSRRARHRSITTLEVDADADLVWVEEIVLGRHGEAGGEVSSTLALVRDGRPALRTTVDTGLPGWNGPAGLAGRRALGQVLLVGRPAARWTNCPRPAVEPQVEVATAELVDGSCLVGAVSCDARRLRDAIAGIVASATPGR